MATTNPIFFPTFFISFFSRPLESCPRTPLPESSFSGNYSRLHLTRMIGGRPTQARFWLEWGSSFGWTESSGRRRRPHSKFRKEHEIWNGPPGSTAFAVTLKVRTAGIWRPALPARRLACARYGTGGAYLPSRSETFAPNHNRQASPQQ
jgi:hypothetical protein